MTALAELSKLYLHDSYVSLFQVRKSPQSAHLTTRVGSLYTFTNIPVIQGQVGVSVVLVGVVDEACKREKSVKDVELDTSSLAT